MVYASPTKRAMVVTLKREKKTNTQIAEKTGLSRSTIIRTYNEFKNRMDFYTQKPKSGRPCKMTEPDARVAARMLASTKARDAIDVQKKHFPQFSAQTIRRHLREKGLEAHVRRSFPLLTERHKKRRREWAAAHRDWEVEDWEFVHFSDESKYNLIGSDGRTWCWRRSNEAYDARFSKKIVKHGGGNVMVWGVITPEGVGRLHRVVGRMDAQQYIEILNRSYLGTLKDRGIKKKNVYFQQDNDPKHTSLAAKHWFSTKRIDVLPWPACSPDMNIIEHVWDHLDRLVRAREVLPRNPDELWAALEEEWYGISPAFIAKLYDSMPRRVEALRKAKGSHTRY
jgi:transposase